MSSDLPLWMQSGRRDKLRPPRVGTTLTPKGSLNMLHRVQRHWLFNRHSPCRMQSDLKARARNAGKLSLGVQATPCNKLRAQAEPCRANVDAKEMAVD